ncbi:MAG TPA: histidine kinase N-terminal 7TM domain-containing protein [Anaerolineae bacterium]|nr:histidine kinase N-terminal 7TM domain-containing protein [Anaerolineae bacterium]HQH37959.1 histidine kinase N-terminal 7TM domain-containing protein [Anaerolineae bacterium]
MSQYSIYFILAPLATFISAAVLLYAWRYQASHEMPSLIGLMFTIVGWLTCNILELAASTAAGTLFWAKMGYLFVTSTALMWVRFALHYTDKHSWLKPSRFAWLCIIPLTTVILVFTNDMHGLMWATYTFVPTSVGQALAIQITRHGLWFYVNVFYEYGLVAIGAVLIIRQSLRSFNIYRRQSVWLVLGSLMPMAGNAIYVFRIVPGLQQDYTSVMFAVGGVAFSIGMLRYRLFDLHPIARNAVIDNMQDAMFALDDQNRIVDLNPAALALMGAAANAILGQPAAQVFSRWHALVEQFQDTSEIQTDITADDGQQQRYYDLHISPLYDHREHMTGRLIVVHDITERKATEVALRERTAALETLNEQLDAFAHTVAHDIKDPLSGIVALTSLLGEYFQNLSPDAIHTYMDAITQNAMRLTSIVDALLLLASVRQVESVKTELLDMPAIVAHVQNRLAVLIAEHQAVIMTPETWPPLRSYGPWVEEVWVNYVSNAIKYGGTPPRVELGFSKLEAQDPKPDPASRIRFWVRDNGPGLTVEQQEQVFTQFTRLSGIEPGHGLGLSIARNIIEKLGGEVGVESAVGQGSVFWFTLPAS